MSKIKILHIEDEEMYQQLVRVRLAEEELDVYTAGRGAEKLQMLQDIRPDLRADPDCEPQALPKRRSHRTHGESECHGLGDTSASGEPPGELGRRRWTQVEYAGEGRLRRAVPRIACRRYDSWRRAAQIAVDPNVSRFLQHPAPRRPDRAPAPSEGLGSRAFRSPLLTPHSIRGPDDPGWITDGHNAGRYFLHHHGARTNRRARP